MTVTRRHNGASGAMETHPWKPRMGEGLTHFMQSTGNTRSLWQVWMTITCTVATASGRSQGCLNLQPAFLRVLKYQEEQITHLVTWAWLRTIGLSKHYKSFSKSSEGGWIAQLSVQWHSSARRAHETLVPKQLIGKKKPQPPRQHSKLKQLFLQQKKCMQAIKWQERTRSHIGFYDKYS